MKFVLETVQFRTQISDALTLHNSETTKLIEKDLKNIHLHKNRNSISNLLVNFLEYDSSDPEDEENGGSKSNYLQDII